MAKLALQVYSITLLITSSVKVVFDQPVIIESLKSVKLTKIEMFTLQHDLYSIWSHLLLQNIPLLYRLKGSRCWL